MEGRKTFVLSAIKKSLPLSATNRKIFKIFSIIAKSLALLVIFVPWLYFSFLILTLSGSPIYSLFWFSTGVFFIVAGIILAFVNDDLPAILRIETLSGLMINYIAGIFGSFSIGGLLILIIIFSAPLLLIDWILWAYLHRENKTRNNLAIVYSIIIIFFQIGLTIVLIKYVLLPWQFMPLFMKLPLLLWNILLFFSVRSYLPKHWINFVATIAIVVLLGSFFVFQKRSEPDETITLTPNSSSGQGELKGTSDYLDGQISWDNWDKELFTFTFQGFIKKHDSSVLSINNERYIIKPTTRSLFWGVLYSINGIPKDRIRYVVLKASGQKDLVNSVDNATYVIQSTDPNMWRKIIEINFLDRNRKSILKEKITKKQLLELQNEIKENKEFMEEDN